MAGGRGGRSVPNMFDNVLIGSDAGADGGEAMALARLLARPDARYTLTGYRDGALLEIADIEHPDLIVLGSHHAGLLGRIALHHEGGVVVDGASCPVAIAPASYHAPGTLQRLGVAHNGSPEAIAGLGVARALAHRHHASVSALAVVSLASIPRGEPIPPRWPEVAADLVDAEQARVGSLYGVNGTAVYGEPGAELAAFGNDLDLLIVGSRGLDRLGRLRSGSTSRYLIRHATCPLLVIGRAATVSTYEPPHVAKTVG
jgi:nucleotide-binding universal stress UspA family protein